MQPTILSVTLTEISPFINWTYFFHAWNIVGKYDGLTTLCSCEACQQAWLNNFSHSEQGRAREVLRLYKDAQKQLNDWRDNSSFSIRVKYGFFKAESHKQVITLYDKTQQLNIPTLRQQQPRPDGTCWALADFVPSQDGRVGLFAVAVHAPASDEDDAYNTLLQKTLSDRLAEATSEYLQQTLLTDNAIRPAFGYPSLPDVSLLFDVDGFFSLSDVGITLTHHAAMLPTSSICGLYIQHPQVRYFMVNNISNEQLEWYARQRNRKKEEIIPFLNLSILP